ncbi:2-hydroxyhepta-2,4-diene-1,7-dioate isomerase [Clostridia bacterium]|nr:2-hydroxyhepta-2,4-diene-1,7-dioate isomerase [Clostridia bacterium]
MQFARITAGVTADPVWCVKDGDKLYEIIGSPADDWKRTGKTFDPETVSFLAPCEPRQLIIVGWNYAEHTRETGSDLPPEPMCYPLSPLALSHDKADVIIPSHITHVEHECELVVVIGKLAKNVKAADALDYVLGVTCGNDVSARDIQNKPGFPNLPRAKTVDTFKPVGPYLTTGVDFSDLPISITINGETRQSARTRDMIFNVPELIEFITKTITLCPGDIIFTGTPKGCTKVKPGDVMAVTIEGVGTLVNTVTAG